VLFRSIPFWVCIFGIMGAFKEENSLLSDIKFRENFMPLLLIIFFTILFAGAFNAIYEDIPQATRFSNVSIDFNLVFQLIIYLISLQMLLFFILATFGSIQEIFLRLLGRRRYLDKRRIKKEDLVAFAIFGSGLMFFGLVTFYFIWTYPYAF